MTSVHKTQQKTKKIYVKTRKLVKNPLLNRKQMLIEVSHFGRGTVPKLEIRDRLARCYGVKDKNCVVVYGFKTAYGGGRSTGFALIYDSFTLAKKYEPRHRLVRLGLADKKKNERRTKKETKKRATKLRGGAKTRPVTKSKKAKK